MPLLRRDWTEREVDELLGKLLRTGVMCAAAIVLAGGLIYLARYGTGEPKYARFRGEPGELTTVGAIIRAAFRLQSRGVIQFGLLVLIATPIARVIFSLYAFVRDRDRHFMVITSFVLVLLLLSVSGVIA